MRPSNQKKGQIPIEYVDKQQNFFSSPTTPDKSQGFALPRIKSPTSVLKPVKPTEQLGTKIREREMSPVLNKQQNNQKKNLLSIKMQNSAKASRRQSVPVNIALNMPQEEASTQDQSISQIIVHSAAFDPNNQDYDYTESSQSSTVVGQRQKVINQKDVQSILIKDQSQTSNLESINAKKQSVNGNSESNQIQEQIQPRKYIHQQRIKKRSGNSGVVSQQKLEKILFQGEKFFQYMDPYRKLQAMLEACLKEIFQTIKNQDIQDQKILDKYLQNQINSEKLFKNKNWYRDVDLMDKAMNFKEDKREKQQIKEAENEILDRPEIQTLCKNLEIAKSIGKFFDVWKDITTDQDPIAFWHKTYETPNGEKVKLSKEQAEKDMNKSKLITSSDPDGCYMNFLRRKLFPLTLDNPHDVQYASVNGKKVRIKPKPRTFVSERDNEDKNYVKIFKSILEPLQDDLKNLDSFSQQDQERILKFKDSFKQLVPWMNSKKEPDAPDFRELCKTPPRSSHADSFGIGSPPHSKRTHSISALSPTVRVQGQISDLQTIKEKQSFNELRIDENVEDRMEDEEGKTFDEDYIEQTKNGDIKNDSFYLTQTYNEDLPVSVANSKEEEQNENYQVEQSHLDQNELSQDQMSPSTFKKGILKKDPKLFYATKSAVNDQEFQSQRSSALKLRDQSENHSIQKHKNGSNISLVHLPFLSPTIQQIQKIQNSKQQNTHDSSKDLNSWYNSPKSTMNFLDMKRILIGDQAVLTPQAKNKDSPYLPRISSNRSIQMIEDINEKHQHLKNRKLTKIRTKLDRLDEEHKANLSSLKKVKRVSLKPFVPSPFQISSVENPEQEPLQQLQISKKYSQASRQTDKSPQPEASEEIEVPPFPEFSSQMRQNCQDIRNQCIDLERSASSDILCFDAHRQQILEKIRTERMVTMQDKLEGMNEFSDLRFLLGNFQVTMQEEQTKRQMAREVKKTHHQTIADVERYVARQERSRRPKIKKLTNADPMVMSAID